MHRGLTTPLSNNVQTFTKDLSELTNDGRIQFVASKSEREEVREERQTNNPNPSETAKGLDRKSAQTIC
jgi:hypothetical protein